MPGDKQLPTLTDTRGLGGVIALDGFDYQLWDGLVRLPAWLADPAFEAMIFEGLEDLEARFFAPQAPHGRLLERYQAKSGHLTPAGVGEVFKTFHDFDGAYPRKARLHTLVTPRLPSTLAWLGRDPDRVRRARPFYTPFADITEACDAKLRSDVIAQFGDELGNFVATAVEVAERSFPDRETAIARFGVALQQAFPHLDASSRQMTQAFASLSELARGRIGEPLPREVLIDLIEQHLDQPLSTQAAFPLHLRSDRHETAEAAALEIDASAFSGGDRGFPDTGMWREGLVEPLERTAQWLRSRAVARVTLGGSYRLSTAFSVGWAFRAAVGFEIDIPTRGGFWATDEHARGEGNSPWQIAEARVLDGQRLVVCVGVLRDPTPDLVHHRGIAEDAVVRAWLPEPLTGARGAQAGVAAIKTAVTTAAARLRPQQIDLYLAVPAAFAVALGHRWNAMPPTQLHEYLAAERRYIPAAVF